MTVTVEKKEEQASHSSESFTLKERQCWRLLGEHTIRPLGGHLLETEFPSGYRKLGRIRKLGKRRPPRLLPSLGVEERIWVSR